MTARAWEPDDAVAERFRSSRNVDGQISDHEEGGGLARPQEKGPAWGRGMRDIGHSGSGSFFALFPLLPINQVHMS